MMKRVMIKETKSVVVQTPEELSVIFACDLLSQELKNALANRRPTLQERIGKNLIF